MERSGRAFWRWFFVCALAIWSIGVVLPSLGRLWAPLAQTGFYSTTDGWITDVERGSPAERAGIRVGERVDLPRMDFESRRVGVGLAVVPAGTYRVAILHGTRLRYVTVGTAPEPLSASSRVGLVLRTLAAIILIIGGVVLVLLRPSLMTWALFVFVVGANPGSHGGFWVWLPYWGEVLEQSLELIAADAGAVGALVFLILFPTNAPISRWSSIVLRLSPWLFGAMALMSLYLYVAAYTLWPQDQVVQADLISHLIVGAVGIAAFLQRYHRAQDADRARIRWVGAALAIGLTSFIVANVLETWAPGVVPYVVLSYLYAALIVVPFAVMYAVVKHHVIDVRFFISRAIVYAVLTALIALFFTVVDWFFSQKLEAAGVGTGLEVLMAITLGFSLKGVHKRIESTVDSVLFRQRHEAERQLRRAARAIPQAPTTAAVEQLLIRVPCDALRLESAALFELRDGRFQRRYSVNWPAGRMDVIPPDDLLVLHLNAEREAVRVSEINWRPEGLSGDGAAPVIAFPIFLRQQLEAFAFYGSHKNGADIDPDEQHALGEIAVSASAAYDHIDAARVRAEMERVAEENRALRLQVAQT